MPKGPCTCNFQNGICKLMILSLHICVFFGVSLYYITMTRKRQFHWISQKSRLVRVARVTSKFQNWSHLTKSRRRYMAKILTIRRKTRFDQSISHILFYQVSATWLSFSTICQRKSAMGLTMTHRWLLNDAMFM